MDRLNDLPAPARAALFVAFALLLGFLGWQILFGSTADQAETSETSETVTVSDDPGQVITQPGSGTATSPVGNEPGDGPISDELDSVVADLRMPVDEDDVRGAAAIAVRFTEMYLSFRYDQDEAARAAKISRYLAEQNTLDLNGTGIYSGGLADVAADRLTTSGEVESIDATLLADDFMTFTVHAVTQTSSETIGERTSEAEYTIAMAFTGGNGWQVQSFDLGDGLGHNHADNGVDG